MDEGVPLSVDLYFKDATDRERVAVADSLDPHAGQDARDGRVRPDPEI